MEKKTAGFRILLDALIIAIVMFILLWLRNNGLSLVISRYGFGIINNRMYAFAMFILSIVGMVIDFAVIAIYVKFIKKQEAKYVVLIAVCIATFIIIYLISILGFYSALLQRGYSSALISIVSYAISFIFAFVKSLVFIIINNAPKQAKIVLPNEFQPNAAVSPPPPGRRFCGACGSEVAGGNAFCPVCGSKLADQLQGFGQMPPHSAAPGYGRPGYVRDAPNAGFAVLGFFFPVIGLILYLVWRETLPLRARSAGKGAIIGVVIYVALVIIIAIARVALINSIFSLY